MTHSRNQGGGVRQTSTTCLSPPGVVDPIGWRRLPPRKPFESTPKVARLRRGGVVKQCSANKRDGSPCTLPAQGADGLCWVHPEDNSEKRKQGQRKGGRSKPLTDIAVLQCKLSDLGDDVLTGRVNRANASVAAQAWGVAVKAIEVWCKIRELEEARLVEAGLKVREQEELTKRLEELERPLIRAL